MRRFNFFASWVFLAFVCMPKVEASQALIISIDGLKPKDMSTLVESKTVMAPFGFSWLYRTGLYSENAYPATTTLTAPSHISTLTCSSPAQHGIVANEFLQGGRFVSGFNADVKTETLVESARRQGKKVLSIGYVSVDGQNARRSADRGLAYPDQQYLGVNTSVDFKWSSLPLAQGWQLGARKGPYELRMGETSVVINPSTGEKRLLQILVWRKKSEGGFGVVVDTDKDLRNGSLAEFHSDTAMSAPVSTFFVEEEATSPLRGVKRRLDLRVLSSTEQVTLHIAGSSYNNAYPASYQSWLDQQDLVWPSKFIRSAGTDPLAHVEEMAVIDRYLAVVAARSLAKEDADLVLFYQPLLDATEHAYEARLPLPLDPCGQDAVSSAYRRAWQLVDQNISEVIQAAGVPRAVMAVGDHGMEAVTQQINLAAAELKGMGSEAVQIVPAGGLALLYAKDNSPAGILAADAYAEGLVKRLEGLPVPAALSGKERRGGGSGNGKWAYGEALWAFMAGPKLWFGYAPEKAEVLMPSLVGGMHGHSVGLASMATGFYLRGQGVGKRDLGRMELLDAVPTLMNFLEWKVPVDCVGRSRL